MHSRAEEAGASRSKAAQATGYQNHRSVLKPKGDVYGLMPAQCRKVKGRAARSEPKPR